MRDHWTLIGGSKDEQGKDAHHQTVKQEVLSTRESRRDIVNGGRRRWDDTTVHKHHVVYVCRAIHRLQRQDVIFNKRTCYNIAHRNDAHERQPQDEFAALYASQDGMLHRMMWAMRYMSIQGDRLQNKRTTKDVSLLHNLYRGKLSARSMP